MKIHEHQAKMLLAARGVATPRGRVAFSAVAAGQAAQELGGTGWVVKAQIHAGGRGKGGGVKKVNSPEEAEAVAGQLLARPLVTVQTGPAGRPVHRVLVEEALTIQRELYLAFTLNRAARQVTLIASTAGGMEIEEVAARTPELIRRVAIDPLLGLTSFQTHRLAWQLGFTGSQIEAFQALAARLYQIYLELDCSLLEVNPLIVTGEGRLVALDAKLTFDPAALPRHPELAELRDPTEEDPVEELAARANLSYVHLDGDIGCLVNGAGLAMATMDLVLLSGGRPANFLDIGGSATTERVAVALGLILDDPRVRAVFVNIFGGIVRCDVVAAGIVAAAAQRPLHVPMVVRLVGTNEAEGARLLAQSGLPVTSVYTMAEGAAAITRLVVPQAGGVADQAHAGQGEVAS